MPWMILICRQRQWKFDELPSLYFRIDTVLGLRNKEGSVFVLTIIAELTPYQLIAEHNFAIKNNALLVTYSDVNEISCYMFIFL